MTGWGTYKTSELNISIRGLNSKYKEIYLHLPQELFYVEPHIYKIVNERTIRGRIDVFVSFNVEKIRKKYVLNDALFVDAYKNIIKLFSKLGIKKDVPLEYILRDVEGVATTQLSEGKGSLSAKKIKGAVIHALNDFEKSKKDEGERLLINIKKYILRIKGLVGELELRFINLRSSYEKKTREKIKELFEKDRDKKILDLNIVEVLEKYDITEEIVRLNSHLKQLMLMVSGKCSGRKIDFFVQEIYREANTINSKIQDSNITGLTIGIKEFSEKIREQAQNLE